MSLKKLYRGAEVFLDESDRLLFFFDEGRFGLQASVTRIWAKRGQPLTVKVKQGYKNFYSYTCVSPVDGESFSLFLPEVNTEMMNIFFEELSKHYGTKEILIVMDQAGWHKANELRIPPNITVEYLPPYSPELNPIEKLWQWLRKEAVHNNIFETLDSLMDALAKQMRELSLKKYAQICRCSYLSQIN